MGFRINFDSTITIDGIPYLWSYGYSPNLNNASREAYTGGLDSHRRVTPAGNLATDDQSAGFYLLEERYTISGFNQANPSIFNNTTKFFHYYYNGDQREGTFSFDDTSLQTKEFFGSFEQPTSIRELINFFETSLFETPGAFSQFGPSAEPIMYTNNGQGRYGYKTCYGAGVVAISAIRLARLGTQTGEIEIRSGVDFTKKLSSLSNPTTNLFFGSAIAISPDRKLAVGAEGNVNGAVILYDTSTTITTNTVSAVITGDVNSARFGASLGIVKVTSSSSFQNKLYVGIPGQSSNTGQVNVYNMDSLMTAGSGLTPSEYTTYRIAQITPSSLGYSGSASRFGEAIAVGDSMIAIGAPDYAELGVKRGAVFLVNPKSNTLIKKIVCPAHEDITGFRSSFVGNDTNTVTCNMNTSDVVSAGQIIEISGALGTEQSKLNGTWAVATASFSSFTFVINSSLSSGTYSSSSNNLGYIRLMRGNSEFGFSIAIGSGRIVIGDPYADSRTRNNTGRVYIYDYAGNLITSTESPFEIFGSGGGSGSSFPPNFGYSVAVGNGKIFVGAPNAKTVGTTSSDVATNNITGLIHIFSLDGSFIQAGFPDVVEERIDVSYVNKDRKLQSDNRVYSVYFLQNDASTNIFADRERSGYGWSMAVGNDTLFAGAVGVSRTGTVAAYPKLLRAYTPYSGVELQKGLC